MRTPRAFRPSGAEGLEGRAVLSAALPPAGAEIQQLFASYHANHGFVNGGGGVSAFAAPGGGTPAFSTGNIIHHGRLSGFRHTHPYFPQSFAFGGMGHEGLTFHGQGLFGSAGIGSGGARR